MTCACSSESESACGEHVTFRVVRGDVFSRMLQLLDPDTGLPIDVAGLTFSGEIREYPGAPTLSASFVFTNQVPSTDGKVLMELAAPVTLAALGYVFDVKRTPNRETQFHGDFVVDETITAI